jgi:hypothetical protein
MRTIKVTYDNGDSIITNINGTESEIRNYYIGNIFNIGTCEDCLVKAVSVKFLE